MPINRTFYVPPTTIPTDVDARTDVRSTWCCLDKGYTPPPFKIVADQETGVVKVVFEPNPFSSTCNCRIECTTEGTLFDGTDQQVGQFCPEDEEFEVVLASQIFDSGSPTTLAFTFRDVYQNESRIEVPTIVAVQPVGVACLPETTDEDRRRNIIVAVRTFSHTFVDLRPIVVQHQIERYIQTPTNSHTWVDWTDSGPFSSHLRDRHSNVYLDRDVRQGVEHGYRVRFRTTFQDVSQWSAWEACAG